MDELPLVTYITRFAVTLGCALTLATFSPALADDMSTLARLEQKLLFQTYGQDPVEARLGRIEKRVFGEAMTGSVPDRLARLSVAAGPQENPDGSTNQAPKSDLGSSDWQAPQGGAPAAAAAPVVKRDPSSDAERIRIAVKAAKEEEITSCLSEGVDLWRNKRGPEALDRFEQVVRLDPGNAEALFSMGIIQEAYGKYPEALSSYQKALKFKPGTKDYSDAIAAVQKKLASKQTVDTAQAETRALYDAAASAYKRNDLQGALEIYKQIDEKTPNQALVKYNIGTVYLMMKVPQKALEYYRQARDLNPSEQRFVEACNKLEPVIQSTNSEVPGDKPAKKSKEKKTKEKSQAPASASNSGGPSIPSDQSVLANSYGIIGKSQNRGVTITSINLASKAARAGLQIGDIIRAIDGTVVSNPGEANQLLSRKGPSDSAQLVIERNSKLAQVIL